MSDRQILEVAAVLLAQFRTDPEAFIPARLSQLHRALSLLGRTPIDRSRLGVTDTAGAVDDPWAVLAREG